MSSQIKIEEIKILESILHGIMVTDMQGHIIYCNPAGCRPGTTQAQATPGFKAMDVVQTGCRPGAGRAMNHNKFI